MKAGGGIFKEKVPCPQRFTLDTGLWLEIYDARPLDEVVYTDIYSFIKVVSPN